MDQISFIQYYEASTDINIIEKSLKKVEKISDRNSVERLKNNCQLKVDLKVELDA